MHPVTVTRALGIFWLSAGLHAAAAAAGQQPRQDDRQIVPTPGVTTVETPGTSRTAPAPDRTPRTTRTAATPAPQASAATDPGFPGGTGLTQAHAQAHAPARAGAAGIGRGPGPGRAAATRPEPEPDSAGSDPRTPATWAVFGALVIALGLMTIRMLRRPGFRPDALLDASAADEQPLDSRA